MKAFLTLLLLATLSIRAQGQQIEKFYTYDWKLCEPSEARFYSFVKNTDSGWQRYDYYIHEKKLQMIGLYMDSACKIGNGTFRYFHPNGILQSIGRYSIGRKTGLWLSYHPNGYIKDSSIYDQDHPIRTSLQWHNNGYLSDSTIYNIDGTAVSYTWFNNGSISSAGRLDNKSEYHGKWQFFHKNGRLSALETYDHGKLIALQYFSEDGAMLEDTSGRAKRPAEFPGGLKAWNNFLLKHAFFPSNYKIVNADKAIVVVDFAVDETGTVTDASVAVSFDKVFDNMALDAVKKSPKWSPAVFHNRNVKYYHRQGINFNQVEY